MYLKKTLKTHELFFASISAMVGSGWLFGPLFTAQMAGGGAIFSWIIGGILVLILALPFAEIITSLPLSGGIAAYSLYTHGRFVGFILAWVFWLSVVFAAPIEVQAAAQYASIYFPELCLKEGNTIRLTSLGFAAATVLMLLLSIINVISVRFMAKTNTWVSVWKIIVPLILIIVFLTTSRHPENLVVGGSMLPMGWQGVLSSIAIGGVIYAYNGFQYGIILAGEAINPRKSIPFAALGAILFCIFMYVFIQLAFLLAVPPSALTQGWENVSFMGDAGPIAGLAGVLGLMWLVHILYLDAIISPLGAGIIQSASSSRSLYAMSLSGYLPKWFQMLNKGGIPYRTVFLNFAIGMLVFLPFPNIQTMISFLSSSIVLSYIIGPICLVAFRKLYPELARPFLLPFPSLFAFLAFYVCNLLVLWTGFETVWKLTVAVFLGILIFALKTQKNRDEMLVDAKAAYWLIPYLIGNVGITYLSTFAGGIGILPFGWDFVVVALFSLMIFLISQKYMLSRVNSEKYMKTKENLF